MIPKLLVALAAVFLAGAAVADDSYRLPLEVLPLAYDVSLVPFLDDAGDRSFTFDGVVVIKVQAQRAVPTITLHATDVTIQSIEVSELEVLSYDLEVKRDFLTLNLNKALSVGALYDITIRYQGNLRNNLAGFYRSSYKTSAGETRWLATTQFEATDARRAFPSFDEPALKATFIVRIAPPIGLHAVSNMPVSSITGPDASTENRFWYNFERTVKMSTYLVAFVVSDFAFVENGPYRILGRAEAIETSRYPLGISPEVLAVMENLTGVAYSLPKMDQVAVPNFAAGAMENWGLVTYRQGYLLLDVDSLSRRRTAATVMAHEFAHQWFGNLVSPDWWTFTWLNEAFASFFEYFDTDKVEPDWDLLSSMVTSMQHSVLRTDARSTTHAITRYVETPSQISSSFDTITYSKGGSLVKMIYHFLTEPTFYKGLNIYLNRKAYGAAVADELFQGWQDAVNEDGVLPADLTVKEILDTWTLQAGYPVLTVTRDYAAGTATITQKRFYTSGNGGDESWWVPVSYTTRSESNFNRTTPRAWLAPGASLTLEGIAEDDWLILNIQDAAFYRVNYDEKNWDLLLSALEQPDYDGIHHLNRAQLLDDASQLSLGLQLRSDHALRALRALRNEPVRAVWRTMLRYIAQLYDQLANSDTLPDLQGAFAKIVEGWARSRAVSVEPEDEEVQNWAFALSDSFSPMLRTPSDINEVSPAVLCAAVRTTDAGWGVAWGQYQSASTKGERRDALAALGCARDAQRLLAAAVADAADAERVQADDRLAALAAPCGSETREAVGGGGARACAQAIDFLAKNAGRRDLFEDVDDLLSVFRRLGARVRTEEQLQMLELAASRIEKDRKLPIGSEVLSDVLQTARTQVDWALSEEGKPIVSWLRKHQAGGRSVIPEEER